MGIIWTPSMLFTKQNHMGGLLSEIVFNGVTHLGPFFNLAANKRLKTTWLPKGLITH